MIQKLRPEQAAICAYNGGQMAVSAVPGSGKTFTLAALASELIARASTNEATNADDEREILVVTFTTSAVDNIRARIRRMLNERGMPDTGYRVLTLHSLAHLIVRMRPDLAGVSPDFQMDDELNGNFAMTDAVRYYTHVIAPDFWQSFLPTDRTAQQRDRDLEHWRGVTERIASEVTRLAKNLRLKPAQLNELIHMASVGSANSARVSPFLQIGAAIYERYDKILSLGGRLDFDDLIWRAITALENDADFCASLGARWHTILEDEAQDSTPLQEHILTLLSRETITRDHHNWVRVGDPNQAIMTTFTASDVRFFRDFTRRADVRLLPLSRSGRSAQPIIDLANRLAHWSATAHPEVEVRMMALTDAVPILPTEPDDPQQNPPAEQARINLQTFDNDEMEAARVAQSALRYVLAAADKTCAILTPTNAFGRAIIEALEREQTQIAAKQPLDRALYQDQLKNPQNVRTVAQALANAVQFCAKPNSTDALARVRRALLPLGVGARMSDSKSEKRLDALLRSVKIERLLFPTVAAEPALPDTLQPNEREQKEMGDLAALAAKWLRASVLPIDQLILTIAQDVLTRESDLAIAHSLAVSMRRYASSNPSAQLGDLADQLQDIAANRQKYLSNSLLESGFEPMPGVVTVTTMHKAKGLEWDRVYLTSVDQQEFPHDAGGNEWRGQVWYLGGADPATEARKQLEMLVGRTKVANEPQPQENNLLRLARLEYIAERMRLLYVGVTRARSELQLSISRKRGDQPRDHVWALAVAETAK